jgi:hypothetical protein
LALSQKGDLSLQVQSFVPNVVSRNLASQAFVKKLEEMKAMLPPAASTILQSWGAMEKLNGVTERFAKGTSVGATDLAVVLDACDRYLKKDRPSGIFDDEGELQTKLERATVAFSASFADNLANADLAKVQHYYKKYSCILTA